MLSAYEYIVSKQIQWARNSGIPLTGKQGKRGRQAYTLTLDQNLFEPLSGENRAQIGGGNGQELVGASDNPAKMQALHSSSALGVNVFQYWQNLGSLDEIAAVCGFCRRGSSVTESLIFEEKYPIRSEFHAPPNIDVVIHNRETAPFPLFAIECKFSESYGGRQHGGLAPAYLQEETLWADLPALSGLAKALSPEDNRYAFLHAAQLIKHILGLHESLGNKSFRLLYLWYDALGKAGAQHRSEVNDFKDFTRADGIKFHAVTYQELILKLARDFREDHPKYIQYLTDRYL
jgi:hypothetical protein